MQPIFITSACAGYNRSEKRSKLKNRMQDKEKTTQYVKQKYRGTHEHTQKTQRKIKKNNVFVNGDR